MPADAVGPLLDLLRDNGLLSPNQSAELSNAPPDRFPDSVSLTREMVRRGWLTGYQAERVIDGALGELVLGPYVLLDRLGAGGMGEVFKARHNVMNRVVALKVIREDRFANPGLTARLRREIQAVARLSHPNIVIAHDAVQAGDTHFYVMEYVEGTDLAKLVKQSGPLPVGLACECARQAALGLQHAHEKGLVHRDVKPANLMLTRGAGGEGVLVKVLDLGLARINGNDGDASGLTRDGMVMGTPDYLAPEQGDDAHAADTRADIYSLGCTLYHLLSGKPPFPGGSFVDKLIKHREIDPPPLEARRDDVPAGLGDVVRRMTAKRPADRYQTPAEAAAALAPFAAVPAGSWPFPAAPSAPAAGPPSTLNATGVRVDTAADVNRGLPPLADPAEVQPAERKLPPRRAVWPWLTASAFTSALLLGGILFYFRGDKTDVLVNVDVDLNDPALSFVLNEQPVTAEQLRKPVELTVGRHELLVKRGNVEERRVVFRVSKDAGQRFEIVEDTRPKAKDPAPALQADADRTRAAIEFVLNNGGMVEVERREVRTLKDLPLGPLRPTRVDFVHTSVWQGSARVQLRDTDLSWIRDLPDSLRHLDLRGHIFTDAGVKLIAEAPFARVIEFMLLGSPNLSDAALEHVARCRRLLNLIWHPAGQMTGAGLFHLKDLPQLGFLQLNETPIEDQHLVHLVGTKLYNIGLWNSPKLTDAGLAHLAQIDTLEILVLNGNRGVTDRGLDHLTRLPKLRRLGLEGSQVTETGFARLTAMPRLTDLVLGGDRVTDASCEHLARLTELTKMSVIKCPVTDEGLARLAPLARLEFLDLTETRVVGPGLAQLKGFDRLTTLLLRGCPVTDTGLTNLPDFPALTELSLDGSRVTDRGMTNLTRLTRLRKLGVTGTAVTTAGLRDLERSLPGYRIDPVPAGDSARAAIERLLNNGGSVEIANRTITAVKDLPLGPLRPTEVKLILPSSTAGGGGNLPRLRDGDLFWLKDLPDSVRGLVLRGHLFTDEGVKFLTNLPTADQFTTLVLESPNLTDAGLEHLGRCRRLQRLDYYGTANVTGAGLIHLRGLSGLKVLFLNGNVNLEERYLEHLAGLKLAEVGLLRCGKVGDGGLKVLSGIESLAVLYLFGTGVTDDGLATLAQHPNLNHLSLIETNVTDAGCEHLARMPKLTRLILTRTGVTDAGVAKVAAPGRLLHLSLVGLPVTAAGLEKLRPCNRLTDLSLDDCPITDVDLTSLPVLPRLETLRLDRTKVTDQGLRGLHRRTGLKKVFLTGASVTDAGLRELKKALPGCQITPEPGPVDDRASAAAIIAAGARVKLRVRGTVRNDYYTARTPLPNEPFQVYHVDAWDNRRIAGTKIELLKDLHSLEMLVTGRSAIDLDALKRLTTYPAVRTLRHLNINDTPAVTNTWLAEIAKFDQLKALYFGKCTEIDDSCVEHFATFPPLEYLNLNGTSVTHDGARKLAAALPRCKIVLADLTIEPRA